MRIHGQVYVGGKRITNRSGNTSDFLYRNGITGNVVLVEIKTPVTPLLASAYRNNAVNVSSHLTGGFMQILNAERSLTQNFTELIKDEPAGHRLLSPRGLLIVGSASQLDSHDEKVCSEMFRNNQGEVDIVTFDELRQNAPCCAAPQRVHSPFGSGALSESTGMHRDAHRSGDQPTPTVPTDSDPAPTTVAMSLFASASDCASRVKSPRVPILSQARHHR
jgi:hypothetical protein